TGCDPRRGRRGLLAGWSGAVEDRMRVLIPLLLLTACDWQLHTVFDGGTHPIDASVWAPQEAPAWRSEGMTWKAGWTVGYGACPAGLALDDAGEQLTFGAWHTVVTTRVDAPAARIDHGFDDHDVVAD